MNVNAIQEEHNYSIEDGQGNKVATAAVHRSGDTYWLVNVWTHPEHRGKGAASALIRRLLEVWGARTMYLTVAPYTDAPLDAAGLRAFYRRFGFHATDVPGVMRRPGYAERGGFG